MGKALNEWLAARVGYQDLVRLARERGQHYEMIHAYIANMGGYYLDFTEELNKLQDPQERPNRTEKRTEAPTTHLRVLEAGNKVSNVLEEPPNRTEKRTEATTTHLGVLEAGDKVSNVLEELVKEVESDLDIAKTDQINLSRLKYDRWTLNLSEICQSRDLFGSLPDVSAQDLERLDSGDALVKLLAIIQVSWLMIQLLVRKISNIPSSQLEIAVLAFSASSLITYAILWNRPQEIDCRYKIQATKIPTARELREILLYGPRYLWTWRPSQGRIDSNLKLAPIPNDASHQVGTIDGNRLESWAYVNNGETLSVVAGSILSGTVFGGLHCLAWNFQFPTSTETLLWRICSILMVALPLLSIPSNIMWSKYNRYYYRQRSSRVRLFWGLILLIVFLIPYLVARLFVMVEIFRSLFYLPPEAFIDTWSGSFPHWG